jgi:hypothetical protein
MQCIQSRYGRYYSKKYSYIGPLYQDRYKAIPILERRYLLIVARYIHRNSTDIGVDPFSYRWSNLSHYKAQKTPSWVDVEIISKEFAKSPFATAYKSYLDWVRDGLGM